jgi:hypothetical protein
MDVTEKALRDAVFALANFLKVRHDEYLKVLNEAPKDIAARLRFLLEDKP